MISPRWRARRFACRRAQAIASRRRAVKRERGDGGDERRQRKGGKERPQNLHTIAPGRFIPPKPSSRMNEHPDERQPDHPLRVAFRCASRRSPTRRAAAATVRTCPKRICSSSSSSKSLGRAERLTTRSVKASTQHAARSSQSLRATRRRPSSGSSPRAAPDAGGEGPQRREGSRTSPLTCARE